MMGMTELLLLAVGLSMDACAVSMTNGMCCKKIGKGWTLAMGACFGVMQGLMPLLGFLLGMLFVDIISAFDHWLALILLGFIGGKMIFEACRHEEETAAPEMTVRLLLLQGIATSIDALAVGIGFSAFADFRILPAVSLIAAVTFSLSAAGVLLGKRFGSLLNDKAQICGGLILIAIGIKIFVQHMWFS